MARADGESVAARRRACRASHQRCTRRMARNSSSTTSAVATILELFLCGASRASQVAAEANKSRVTTGKRTALGGSGRSISAMATRSVFRQWAP
ncbi:hypothetical protein GY14_04545 [Delftia tsuruhatensis]|nr:hypothetical protein GY14_04545 [Delftia tsuruhatensis]